MKFNMRRIALLFWGILTVISAQGQVGIGTTNVSSSAQMEVSSTSKGLLIPRLTHSQMQSISNPAEGLQVYNTDFKGVYYYNGSEWLSALNSLKVFADAGDDIEFDNLSVRIPSSGNKSIQLRTLTGTINMEGTSLNKYVTSAPSGTGAYATNTGYIKQTVSLSTSYSYWQNINFAMHGSTQEIWFSDDTNNRAYRILMIIGYNYLDNFIEIERIDTN